MSRKLPVFEPPEWVFPTRKKLASGEVRTYWYHQPNRHESDKAKRGKLTRLPEPNTPEWHAALAKLTEPQPVIVRAFTVDMLWDDYRKSALWPRSLRSRWLYASIYKNHIQPSCGASAVQEVDGPFVAGLRDSRSHKPQTANMLLAVMTNMWIRAVEIGKAQANIPKGIARLRVDPEEARPVSAKAWHALTRPEAPEDIRRFAYLARGTGQRAGDVLAMRPQQREDDGIRHKIQKTGHKRKIDDHWSPVRADLLAVIDSWQTWPTRQYMHIKSDRDPPNYGRFLRRWHRYASTPEGDALKGFTPHDLRATCVCDDRLAGFNELQISARRAMSTDMVQKYSRHINQKLAAKSKSKTADGG